MLRKSEFGELLASDEGIATNILIDRLARLQQAGLAVNRDHSTDCKKFRYELTQAGRDLAPALVELILWSDEYVADVKAPPEAIATIRARKQQIIARLRAGLPILSRFDPKTERMDF